MIRLLRRFWNQLTSMRVALILLFLLASAAIPGALLPQHELNAAKTSAYIHDHGTMGRIMDKLQLFSVFSSSWFTAIYALLFISLIGCIIPRTIVHYRAWRAVPPPMPKNPARLPFYAAFLVDNPTENLANDIYQGAKHCRKKMRKHNERVDIALEKGFLREAGNLIFHSALVLLLVSVAAGKLTGYSGIRLINVGDGLCTTSPASFDSFKAGSLVDGTHLRPTCLTIDNFTATYLPNGQADQFISPIRYQSGGDIGGDSWKPYALRVNHPLRTNGQRIYLLGHGYSPTITITYPNGQKRTQTMQFKPMDPHFFLSEGAMRFDPPRGMYPEEKKRRRHQISIEGLFAPTAEFHGKLLTSSFPAARKPALAIDVYEGDNGLDSGKPQNVYELDHSLITSGRLVRQARINLAYHASYTLHDGIKIELSGFKQWIAVQASYDPTQLWVFIAAVLIVVGLIMSLTIKRKRLWISIPTEITPENPVITCGLTRTDSAGWGEKFAETMLSYIPTKYRARCISTSELPKAASRAIE